MSSGTNLTPDPGAFTEASFFTTTNSILGVLYSVCAIAVGLIWGRTDSLSGFIVGLGAAGLIASAAIFLIARRRGDSTAEDTRLEELSRWLQVEYLITASADSVSLMLDGEEFIVNFEDGTHDTIWIDESDAGVPVLVFENSRPAIRRGVVVE